VVDRDNAVISIIAVGIGVAAIFWADSTKETGPILAFVGVGHLV
jgi:hypothetical protein